MSEKPRCSASWAARVIASPLATRPYWGRWMPTFIAGSCDDATHLEVDDLVHVEPDALEDLVAVLVELRCALRDGRRAVVLHRCRDEIEGRAVGRLQVLDEPVGHGLHVLDRLEGV